MKINLKQFCNEKRNSTAEPFNIGDYTYATNGHILIRVDRDPQYDGNEGVNLSKMPFDHTNFTAYHDIPALPKAPKCPECAGTGTVTTCPECEGDGEVALGNDHNEYYAECKTCDGDGYVNGESKTCPFCNGTRMHYATTDSTIIEGYRLSLAYLSLIKALPGPQLAFEADDTYTKPVRFKFTGGCGLLMPMRGKK